MRDPKRIKKVCDALEKAWNESPDMRLGQLLINYVFYVKPGTDLRMWMQEDDKTLDKLLCVKEVRDNAKSL